MKTAFVLAGGGSFGAVQVGMLRELMAHGLMPDLVVGSSVGAINGAYLVGSPDFAGVERLEAIWRGLRRRQVFPITWRTLAGSIARQAPLVDPGGLRRLLEQHLPYHDLERAPVPLHVVATDLLSGNLMRLSSGAVVDAVLASCSIPGAFPPVRIDGNLLVDGAVASNTPVQVALDLGAARIVVLPSGFACALEAPPRGAIATALHAITLLIAHQLVADLERSRGKAEIVTVPPLCPLAVSAYDFSRAGELIERAATQTRAWLDKGGLARQHIPAALRPHVD
ncbi:MAG TPA: patatin-like phospholipase family protein [Burkholderiaceae bacterium]|nr:patatin-like phospholipase family protein [Burkholderiaceae bacterium]